jgi:nucleotide-binding universal stress UspA family protein
VTPKGAPAATILKEAEAHDGNLIVVGARGLGALKRTALGSVSESVLRHARCPVLVVRPRV